MWINSNKHNVCGPDCNGKGYIHVTQEAESNTDTAAAAVTCDNSKGTKISLLK